MNVPEEDFKEGGDALYESIKMVFGVKSIYNMPVSEVEDMHLELRVYYEETYGSIAPLPRDPDPEILDRMDMTDFLAYYKNKP